MAMNREELLKLTKEEAIDYLLSVIADMAATIKAQSEKITELEARLNQNSKNSSKPPSSDGFKKPKSLRKPSDKKPGGQYGHEGSGLKLMNEPDTYIMHEPKECACCPHTHQCRADAAVQETRYEIDITIVTNTRAHQIIQKLCPLALKVLTGCFPHDIHSTVQYGANLEALAVSLNTVGVVSINRTHEILSGVFGVPISCGTISAMVSGCARKVSAAVQAIKEAVISEPILHTDETGSRVDGRTAWAHTAGTDKLTYIAVHENRGKKGMDAVGVLPLYRGTVIHDCWMPYFRYEDVRHGLCNAHLLRELTAVLENSKQAWAQALIDLLLKMKHTKEKLILRNSLKPTPYYLKQYSCAYDGILKQALKKNPVPAHDATQRGRPKRGTTGALVDRLIAHKEKILLFFTDFTVPFDNNQAERDIRMFKVKQKVSGCFRTMEGAHNFAAIMSFIGTARKHGLSAFHVIKDALIGNPFSINSLIATE